MRKTRNAAKKPRQKGARHRTKTKLSHIPLFIKPLPEALYNTKTIRQVFWLVFLAAPSHPQGQWQKITEEFTDSQLRV
jgi:hypothetical protein